MYESDFDEKVTLFESKFFLSYYIWLKYVYKNEIFFYF